MENIYDLAIIGGGAAGLAACVAASRLGDHVIILEGASSIGRKIMVSGNGRCNLMNVGIPRYYGASAFAGNVLSRCGAAEQTRFWNCIGLVLASESDGRVYPCTYQAASVLDVLRREIGSRKAEICLNTRIRLCRKENDGFFILEAENGNRFRARRVIAAAGGAAALKPGSAESGYGILKGFGHTIHPLFPALVPVETDRRSISGLSGIRIRCTVTLTDPSGKELHRESGEVLFSDTGVSGICVMQCARFISGEGCCLELDIADRLFPDDTALSEELIRRMKCYADMEAQTMLVGLVPSRISYAVMKQAGVPLHGEKLGEISGKIIPALIYTLHHYRITVTGTRGMENAQVTAGGAACEEFRPDTLESVLVPGLHAAGEILDVDGDCGGFNLMFAFGSGILAGLNGRKPNF